MTTPANNPGREPAATTGAASALQGLRLRGPVVAGASVLSGMLGAAALWAGIVPFNDAFVTVDARLADRTIHAVRHDGGIIGKVHVVTGQRVAAGDLLASIDAGDIDAKIAQLKTQADAAGLQLESVRREAQAFNVMLEQRLVSRTKVSALESQLTELERESSTVVARIADAERQLARVEIRTPVAGVVQSMPGLVVGRSLAAGETLAQIAPDPDRIVVEAALLPQQVSAATVGAEARIWLDTLAWRDGKQFSGQLTWLASEPSKDNRRAARFEVAVDGSATDANGKTALASGTRAVIVLRTGKRTIVQQLFDPIRRTAGRQSSS